MRIVGVLDRERVEVNPFAAQARVVKRAQFALEQTYRPGVHPDMVDHHEEHVIL